MFAACLTWLVVSGNLLDVAPCRTRGHTCQASGFLAHAKDFPSKGLNPSTHLVSAWRRALEY